MPDSLRNALRAAWTHERNNHTSSPGSGARTDTPLLRPREGRVIAGVAAGIATRLGVGTGWIRASFVVACFFGGLGLLLYVIAWLAIPEEGETESIAASRAADLENSSRWIGVALIVVGGLLVLSWTNAVRAELVWAGALILLGVLLYRGEFPTGSRRRVQDPPPPPPPVDTEEPVEAAVTAPVAPSTLASDSEVAAPPPPPPSAPAMARQRPPRSMLGRFTLATIFVAVGVLAILDNAGVIEPEARHYVGTVVAVTGLGLIIGAWVGKARALIAVGIILLPVLLVASVIRVPFSNDFGEKSFTPASVAQVADEYRLGAGELRIDLSLLEAETVSFEATVGAGQLTVIVPRDAAVSISSRVGFGEVDVLGFVKDGVGREVNTEAPAGAVNVITIDAEVGFGVIEIYRASR